MNTYVLDTSVAVAWYLNESFSTSARLWQERFLKGEIMLIVPSLHFWEFADVLRTLVQRRELEEGLARDIFELHLDAPISKAEPDERKVLDVAFEYLATAYDAVYICLCLSRGVPLLTAERTSTPWVAKLRDHIEIVK